jgi:hypothetical protein
MPGFPWMSGGYLISMIFMALLHCLSAVVSLYYVSFLHQQDRGRIWRICHDVGLTEWPPIKEAHQFPHSMTVTFVTTYGSSSIYLRGSYWMYLPYRLGTPSLGTIMGFWRAHSIWGSGNSRITSNYVDVNHDGGSTRLRYFRYTPSSVPSRYLLHSDSE